MTAKWMTFSLLMTAWLATSNIAIADTIVQPPKLITVRMENVFAPPGFDNNDNAQIVIHGQLPSTCYKTVKPSYRVDHASRRIFVSALAYYYTGCFCLDVVTPYTHTVDLGVLAAGNYQVLEVDANGRSIARGNLPIAIARTPEPDQYLYAPVKAAMVEKNGAQTLLHIKGVFPSDCLELQQVATLHRAPRIIEVLPLAYQKPGVQCVRRNRTFDARVALPATEAGDSLIHIRSMNGDSLNLVEEF
jgi:hypothetical protein